MAKITVFVPRRDMMEQFETIASRYRGENEVEIRLVYVFGTPTQIAILIHNMTFHSMENIERFCGARVRIYDVTDEANARVMVDRAIQEGAQVIVAAGTVCGICRERGFPNIHVKTKDAVIDGALQAQRSRRMRRADIWPFP